MLNIQPKQWFAISILFFSVLMGASAQLVPLLGENATRAVISLSTLINSFLAGAQIILGTQSAQVKDVLAMPGVDKIDVNSKASPALAAIAVDPKVDKIAPIPEAQNKVEDIAKGTAT